MLSRCFCLSFLSSLCTLAFISLYSFLSLCLASRFLSMRFSVSSVIQGFIRSFFLYPTISSAVVIKTFFVSSHNSFGFFPLLHILKPRTYLLFLSHTYILYFHSIPPHLIFLAFLSSFVSPVSPS